MLTHRPDDDVALLLARTRALDPDQVATWDLPADPAVVAHARQHASDQLTAWGLDDTAPSSPNWSSANWSPTPSATAARPSSCA